MIFFVVLLHLESIINIYISAGYYILFLPHLLVRL